VQCGKALSYPCYKSLLGPMSKGKFIGFPQYIDAFQPGKNCQLFPLTLVHSTLLGRRHNWTFPVRQTPWECSKTPCVGQFLVACIFSLSLVVKLDKTIFPQGNWSSKIGSLWACVMIELLVLKFLRLSFVLRSCSLQRLNIWHAFSAAACERGLYAE
jgi:hypothetical protein